MKHITLFIFLVLGTLLSFPHSVSADATLMVRYKDYQKTGDHPLIVVHASTEFNANQRSKKGLDTLISEFKAQEREVYYLYSNEDAQNKKEALSLWYTDDKEPTELLYSYGGENNLISDSHEFTVAGGFLGSSEYFDGCLTSAISSLIKNHFDNYKTQIKVNISMSSVYSPLDRSGRTMEENFQDKDVRGFLAWLITDSNKALREFPGKDQQLEDLPLDLSKIVAKNYQCNYKKNKDCHYLVYGGIWNFFKKDPDWALAAPSFDHYGFVGLENGISFNILKNGELIGHLGESDKVAVLNFVD